MVRVEQDSARDAALYCPNEGAHSATLILIHGLGDSADGLSDLADTFSRALPFLKIIVPTASTRPVTLSGGMHMRAWYDITSLDATNPMEVCNGIDESMSRINQFIDSEHQLGIPYHRIALAGFSQGGALSLYTGLQSSIENRLAGLLCLSGYLPSAGSFKYTQGLEELPILHCHGTADPV
eukprot:gene16042-21777_t